MQPILLRRTSSINPPSAGAPDPNTNIPIADEDPGLLSISTHKRKQSGIPLDAEVVISRSAQISLEPIQQSSDVEEGESALMTSSSYDGQQQTDYSQVYSNERFSTSTLFSSRGMSILAVIAMIVTFATLHAMPQSDPVESTDRPIDAKGVEYGEEHIEIVGTPKEAHMFNDEVGGLH